MTWLFNCMAILPKSQVIYSRIFCLANKFAFVTLLTLFCSLNFILTEVHEHCNFNYWNRVKIAHLWLRVRNDFDLQNKTQQLPLTSNIRANQVANLQVPTSLGLWRGTHLTWKSTFFRLPSFSFPFLFLLRKHVPFLRLLLLLSRSMILHPLSLLEWTLSSLTSRTKLHADEEKFRFVMYCT